MGNETRIGIYKNQEGYKQGKTTIPSFIIAAKGISHGDSLVWEINNVGQIVVTPKKR